MSIGVQAFQGARLNEARRARGMYKKVLGDLIGVSGTAISRYEDGLDKPQHDKLCAIASQLGFSYEFFLKPVWTEEIGLVFWRSRNAETKTARDMTEQRMRWLCEVFSFLEDEVTFPSYTPPELGSIGDPRQITPEIVERAAEQVREQWKLGNHPIPDVALALENAGIPVVNLEIPSDKQDGFCFYSRRLERSFVGINIYDVSCARARYDCAHELGHMVLHSQVTPQQERDPSLHKLIEQQAHRFAGALLFPRKAFFEEVRNPSLDYFASLKKRWGLSIGAMIFRAYNLDMINDQERTVLYRNLTRRGWRGALREPFDDRSVMPLERPRMFKRGVETLLSEGYYTRSGLLDCLSLPEQEVEQITGVEPGFFRSGELVQLAVPKNSKTFRSLDLESGEIIEFSRRFK
ncbi:helix-turn-helix domain-containing protein [Methylobacterium sp. Gmos1]